LKFAAVASSPEAPALIGHWDFGDGTSADGLEVQHAFTHAGEYDVQATVTGLGAATDRKSTRIVVSGDVPTRFEKEAKQRP
jgi:PKD repeat protein